MKSASIRLRLLAARCFAAGTALLAGGFAREGAATYATDQSVMLTATTQSEPARITLHWPARADVVAWNIYRKTRAQTSWGTQVGVLQGDAVQFADATVQVGDAFEYRVNADITKADGYIYAGLEAPLIETRGGCALVVDDTHASTLAAELDRLERDLAGDGWTATRIVVSRTNSVPDIKARIVTVFTNAPTKLRALLIVGHVPVPYSGLLNPDGHSNHRGAWPADCYYGDMDGAWTDSMVNSPSGGRVNNVPGDGRFDQSSIPSDVELMVGRVDAHDMPAFGLPEADILRRYLDKNHAYRQRMRTAAMRAVIDDNFTSYAEGFAQTGWRNFAPICGVTNVAAGQWDDLKYNDYLWGYGCGPGAYEGANGVAGTSQYAADTHRGMFQVLFGSYFGDWDTQDNFLRAPICQADFGLACFWAGRPNWVFHGMGLGEPVGTGARDSLNNTGLYRSGSYRRYIHIALMGDPTIRTHYVAPASNVTATLVMTSNAPPALDLAWADSPDDRLGYHVYRGAAPTGPFTRLTVTPVTTNTFTDDAIAAAPLTVYMIRTVALRTSPSGSYYDAAQGAFATLATDVDTDGDGAPDVDEWHADTDAADSNSVLRVIGTRQEANGIRIDWTGGTAARQTLCRRTSLTDAGAWLPVFTNEPPTPVTNTTVLDAPPANTPAFYRIDAQRP